jgi:Uma2 family endonuclease
MTLVEKSAPPLETLADLVERLGDIPLSRIRLYPAPGTATEADAIAAEARQNRLCELVDGVLVEKAMGFVEACLAGAILSALRAFVIPRNLGVVSGADGMVSLFPDLIRIPDVAYASWDRLPGGRMPSEPAPRLAPDLAVEVLSASNTVAEMARKRREYFEAGVHLVWMVDPRVRTVTVYDAPDQPRVLGEADTLDGGDVLPGFELPLRQLFAELDRKAGA